MEQSLTVIFIAGTIHIRCTVRGNREKQINSIRKFSYAFIRPGTKSVKTDTIKIHCLSEPHKVATNFERKSRMGAEPQLESVIQDTPIGKAIKKCMPKIKMHVEFCLTKLTITFYLPFSDIPGLLKLQEKNKTPEIKECYRNNRVTAKFTDSIAKVTKDSFAKDLAEACYLEVWIVALLRKNLCVFFPLCGKPTFTFLSIKPVNNAKTEGIHSCIKKAFERIGVPDLSKKLLL